MNTDIQTELLALQQRHLALWEAEKGTLPTQLFDPEWLSPCQVGQVVGDQITWKATPREEKADLKNIEEALEITLHPSIEVLFCTNYCDHLPCEFDGHPIELIQVWNEQDFSGLQENMIAHFMMQKRLKKPASMFIATCSDEMQVISILNETGQVQLETLGKKQEAVLAESLAEFLSKLTPILP
ncbi:SecY-interacting protein [Psychromonas sp. B3M02]|uniref:SecY-interacting protein n=1 Tax=Psychromonas sp. B3M02 TaxID=2267226 RepID=UPI000DEA893E|nr:SecY-interacting protein [Psychromonas sp. B3M02]RBW47325.1 SecY-interacting protein [Psychromonas sp. B3M02]